MKNSTTLFILSFLLMIIAPSFGQLSEAEIFQTVQDNIEQFRKGDVVIHVTDGNGNSLKKASISIDQVGHDFMFGALLFDLTRDQLDPERETMLKERFLELFNYGIFPFYWSGYEYRPGHPRYDRMHATLDWCIENGITRKGHPLAWTHEAGMPDWILEMSLEDSETMLESRIMENVAGFEEIQIWDVVNEPVNTVTWEMAHADKEGRHRYTTEVPLEDVADWVEKAYKAAHRADPSKQLVLNEFKQIADPATRERFYKLVTELLDRGTPINGLGLQAHEPRDEWYDPVDVWNTIELYTEFGLPLHITEFSPQSKGAGITGDYRTGSWTEETQAEFTEMMYRLWFGHPSVASINWWGFSDANAWLPGCGITDKDLNPKPVYNTLKKLIREEWTTKGLELETGRKGSASFRGFYGTYYVEVASEGSVKSSTLELEKGKENVWEIVVGR
ncbi:MAG: endo-1,4-beta-xylanase [Bacteroidales bacterium]|nr:endo-1,4-beta-xylanase [Bacteroidales bacterium]